MVPIVRVKGEERQLFCAQAVLGDELEVLLPRYLIVLASLPMVVGAEKGFNGVRQVVRPMLAIDNNLVVVIAPTPDALNLLLVEVGPVQKGPKVLRLPGTSATTC